MWQLRAMRGNPEARSALVREIVAGGQGAGGHAVAEGGVAGQVAAVAAGFAIIWALAWRRQDSAVTAIEDRDGFRFYVDRTPPRSPIRLIRTPGLMRG